MMTSSFNFIFGFLCTEYDYKDVTNNIQKLYS